MYLSFMMTKLGRCICLIVRGSIGLALSMAMLEDRL
jgi:hypothetical protein